MEKKNYIGMTVNERLYVSGRIDEFDEAVSRRDKRKIVSILRDLKVDEDSILAIIGQLKISPLLLNKRDEEE